MTHKNERWASLLAIAICILFMGSLESASAHLSLYSLSSINQGIAPVKELPKSSSAQYVDLQNQITINENKMPSSSKLSIKPITENNEGMFSNNNRDFGLSLLEQSSSLITSYSQLPKEGGIYLSASLSFDTINKFLDFFSNFDTFKQNILGTTKKIIISNSKTTQKIADSFTSFKDGTKYFLKLNQINTVMSADGFFAEVGDTGIISLGDVTEPNKLFSVLFHEMVHAAQFSSDKFQNSKTYNFFQENVRTFSTSDLKSSLNWVQSELEAHKSTANFIDSMLSLPDKSKRMLLSKLGLNEQSLKSERDSELTKFGWYQTEEIKIIDELMGRKEFNKIN